MKGEAESLNEAAAAKQGGKPPLPVTFNSSISKDGGGGTINSDLPFDAKDFHIDSIQSVDTSYQSNRQKLDVKDGDLSSESGNSQTRDGHRQPQSRDNDAVKVTTAQAAEFKKEQLSAAGLTKTESNPDFSSDNSGAGFGRAPSPGNNMIGRGPNKNLISV